MVFVDYRGEDISHKEKAEFAKRLGESWEVDYNQTIPFIDSDLVNEYADRTSPLKKTKTDGKSSGYNSSIKKKVAGNYASPKGVAKSSSTGKGFSGFKSNGTGKSVGTPKKVDLSDGRLKEKLEEMLLKDPKNYTNEEKT